MEFTTRWLLAPLILGLASLLAPPATLAAGSPPPLQVALAVTGGARVAGDHATASATVTNTGGRPLRDVVVMLSLADATGSPAVPLGVEDWTPTPEAVHAEELAPGARLAGSWPLRMIQAGRLEVFATAVAGSIGSVTNSRPVVLNIASTHNVTPSLVLPVALGVPLVVLGGLGTLLWRRRQEVSA